MPEIRFTCSACQAVMKTTNAALAGKTTKCAKCGAPCPIPAPVPEQEPEVEFAEEVAEEVPPQPRKREPEERPRRRSLLPVLLLCGFGLIVLAGAGVVGARALGWLGDDEDGSRRRGSRPEDPIRVDPKGRFLKVPVVAAQAEQLARMHADKAEEAKQRYEGKRLEVSGKVEKVLLGDGTKPAVSLEGYRTPDGKKKTVTLYFVADEQHRHRLARLKPGTTVTAVGKYQSDAQSAEVRECTLLFTIRRPIRRPPGGPPRRPPEGPPR
jgi:hypothetical protein